MDVSYVQLRCALLEDVNKDLKEDNTRLNGEVKELSGQVKNGHEVWSVVEKEVGGYITKLERKVKKLKKEKAEFTGDMEVKIKKLEDDYTNQITLVLDNEKAAKNLLSTRIQQLLKENKEAVVTITDLEKQLNVFDDNYRQIVRDHNIKCYEVLEIKRQLEEEREKMKELMEERDQLKKKMVNEKNGKKNNEEIDKSEEEFSDANEQFEFINWNGIRDVEEKSENGEHEQEEDSLEVSFGFYPPAPPPSELEKLHGAEWIELEKNIHGLGVCIAGGIDNELCPGDSDIYVTGILEKGAVAQDGRLKIGDKILAINEKSLIYLRHDKAVSTIMEEGSNIRILRQPSNLTFEKSKSQRKSLESAQFNLSTIENLEALPRTEWIELEKEDFMTWGIHIKRNDNCYETEIIEEGIFVSQIVKGGAVAADGRLKTGDKLLAINDIPIGNMALNQATNLFAQADTKIKILRQSSEVIVSSRKKDCVNIQKSLNIEDLEARPRTDWIELPKGYWGVLLNSNHNISLFETDLTISKIFEGAPVALNGRLELGDKILAIEDEILVHLTPRQAVDQLKTMIVKENKKNTVRTLWQKKKINEKECLMEEKSSSLAPFGNQTIENDFNICHKMEDLMTQIRVKTEELLTSIDDEKRRLQEENNGMTTRLEEMKQEIKKLRMNQKINDELIHALIEGDIKAE